MRIVPKFLRPKPAPEPKPRPEISAPMHPRPYGHPVIGKPLNARPFGAPDPNAGARNRPPEPVGPNFYKQAVESDPENAKKYSPNYPTTYTYPFGTDGFRGLPTLRSGPSLLHPDYRVGGDVDYAHTPDRIHGPDPRLIQRDPDPEHPDQLLPSVWTSYLAAGSPPDAEGKPTLPG